MATENGILIYNQSFPPSTVERDIYNQLMSCLKCYKYEHKSEDCPTPSATLCSECAANDHIYRNCRSDTKKCLSDGNHRTFAAKCPISKKIIQKKKKSEKDQGAGHAQDQQLDQHMRRQRKAEQDILKKTSTSTEQFCQNNQLHCLCTCNGRGDSRLIS